MRRFLLLTLLLVAGVSAQAMESAGPNVINVYVSSNNFVGPLNADTLNTGQGDNELYDMDQNVTTGSTVTYASGTYTNQINSAGFKVGANELTTVEFANLDGVDQSLATTSTPTFSSMTATNQVNSTGFKVGANELTTVEFANLDGVDQTLATTSTPTFSSMTATNQVNSAAFKIGANELTTTEFGNIDGIDQSVATTSTVTFSSGTFTNQVNSSSHKATSTTAPFIFVGVFDVAVDSPTVVRALAIDGATNVLYISTNTTDLLGWVKVGGQ